MAEVANPKVILKKKQVPTVVDYCLEESIEFSVKQQSFPDTDWEIEIKLKDYKAAVLLGMFLRENRIEIDGAEAQKKRTAKKAEEKADAPSKSNAKEEKNKQENISEIESTESTEPTLM